MARSHRALAVQDHGYETSHSHFIVPCVLVTRSLLYRVDECCTASNENVVTAGHRMWPLIWPYMAVPCGDGLEARHCNAVLAIM
jgi:hypothetical protein